MGAPCTPSQCGPSASVLTYPSLEKTGGSSVTVPQTAPNGTWRSPITPEMVTEAGIRLGEIKTDGDDVYWLEGRPAEGGRNVVVRLGDGNGPVDVTPTGYNVRNRVHEYGGAAYEVKDGVVHFSNFADQRIYRHRVRRATGPGHAGSRHPRGRPVRRRAVYPGRQVPGVRQGTTFRGQGGRKRSRRYRRGQRRADRYRQRPRLLFVPSPFA